MPAFKSWFTLWTVTIAFVIQILIVCFLTRRAQVQQEWVKYRCDPSYWMYSTDPDEDLQKCVQKQHISSMGFTLQPMTTLLNSLSRRISSANSDVNNNRKALAQTRQNTADSLSGAYSTFSGLAVEMQRASIGVQDMISKLIGVVVSLIYMMEGANMTMVSMWDGPTGGMVRALSCFHPNTPVQLRNGRFCKMKYLRAGDRLSDGSSVHATMRIVPTEPLYRIKRKRAGLFQSIYVTGSHHIWHNKKQQFVQVKEHPDAKMDKMRKFPSYYCCLITTSGKIQIGKHTFLDWEDDNVFTLRQMLENPI